MRVQWTQRAELDRLDIWQHVAADNPQAAERLDELFGHAAERLSAHPRMGRPGRIAGTRELVVNESYRLVYELDEAANTLLILVVLHNARQWPPMR